MWPRQMTEDRCTFSQTNYIIFTRSRIDVALDRFDSLSLSLSQNDTPYLSHYWLNGVPSSTSAKLELLVFCNTKCKLLVLWIVLKVRQIYAARCLRYIQLNLHNTIRCCKFGCAFKASFIR